MWIRFFKFWLRVCFHSELDDRFKGIVSDYLFSPFIRKIQTMGKSVDLLDALPLVQVFRTLKIWVLDIERQAL